MIGKLAAMILAVAVTQAQSAIPEGTYSNVCLYPETDDLGGVELQITYAAGKPNVMLWVCEGGCGRAQPTSKIEIRSNQIKFVAADQTFYSSGKPAQTTLRQFSATLEGRVLVLKSPTYFPKRLKLQKQPGRPEGNPKALPIAVRRCS